MIQSNELRIGNWVEFFGIRTKIKAIDEDLDASIIDPIPLTEEILLKCGFLNLPLLENHFYIKGMLIWKCEEMFMHDKTGVQLKHIHQLQNLYFALTNQDLNVKL